MAQRGSTGVWLAIGVGLACLLTAGGSMTTTDAVITYDVTRSLVERGSVAMTGEVSGYEAYRGADGRYYSPFGIAQSIWNIPFYVAGRTAARQIGGRVAEAPTIPKAAVALATVPAVALLAWVCFQLLLTLGAPPRQAVLTILLLVFATSIWPYSGFGFNQPLTSLFLWASVLGAVSATAASPHRLVLAGVCAGLAVLTRHEMVVAAAVIGGFIARRPHPSLVGSIFRFGAGFLPLLAAWGALNWWRFGHPLESGYFRDDTPGFGSSLLVGGAGLLFSPYSSLLLYCPIVLLSVVGLRALWRRNRPVALLFVTLFVAFFFLYASLGNWMGGRSYGPRYLVPLLPALVLPLAFWSPAPRWRPLCVGLALISVLVQCPGVLVDYSKVRMQRAAAGETVPQDRRWRGTPLLLNAQATLENGIRAVGFLTSRDTSPRVAIDDAQLSTALSFSLDLWWLHLAYLGLIGRATALTIAAALAAGAALALRRAWVTAASRSSAVRHP